MTNSLTWSGCLAVAGLWAVIAHAQSTLMPPQCVGKTGPQLDQCVRNIAQPTTFESFEPTEQKINTREMTNCVTVNRADEALCMARNDIVIECRKAAKYPDFDACTASMIGRAPPPRAAECGRLPRAQRSQCALRNKVYGECLKDPWLYFFCLAGKMKAK